MNDSAKSSWPLEQDVRNNWPGDVDITDDRVSQVIRSVANMQTSRWGWIAHKDTGTLRCMIRKMFPQVFSGQYAVAGEPSEYSTRIPSAGPFSHGAGGGRRIVRKADGMT